VLFSTVIPYHSVGWDSEVMVEGSSEWFVKSIPLNQKDELKDYLNSLLIYFEKTICAPLKAALGLIEKTAPTEKTKVTNETPEKK
jgi:hypothetical protein